jgi:hypothetical protein
MDTGDGIIYVNDKSARRNKDLRSRNKKRSNDRESRNLSDDHMHRKRRDRSDNHSYRESMDLGDKLSPSDGSVYLNDIKTNSPLRHEEAMEALDFFSDHKETSDSPGNIWKLAGIITGVFFVFSLPILDSVISFSSGYYTNFAIIYAIKLIIFFVIVLVLIKYWC